MDPICKEKIQYLQKYVPFLANLIDLLANDTEKESKLAQMQLLFNLLSKPDNSVKIETLEKCEEVLSRVFDSADDKQSDSEIIDTNADAPKPTSDTMPEQKTRSPRQVDVKDAEGICEAVNGCVENEKTVKGNEIVAITETENTQCGESSQENSSSKDNSEEVESLLEDTVEHKIEETTAEEPTTQGTESSEQETTENVGNEEKMADEKTGAETSGALEDLERVNEDDLENVEINDKLLEEDSVLVPTSSEISESTTGLVEENSAQGGEDENTFILPDDGVRMVLSFDEINKEEPLSQSEVGEVSSSQADPPEEIEEASSSQTDPAEEIEEASSSKADRHEEIEETSSSKTDRPEEIEEACPNQVDQPIEIEDVSSRQADPPSVVREVSDDIGGGEGVSDEQSNDVIMQSQTEMLPFRIISAESLAVQSLDESEHLIKSIQDNKDTEVSIENHSNGINAEESSERDDHDPLDLLHNTAEKPEEVHEPESVPEENGTIAAKDKESEKNNHNDDDDDDDDVLLIETRLSPICIDSDPEDEDNMKLSQSLPIIPAKTGPIEKPQPQQRMSARKSTSMVNTLRHIIKHQNISITKIPNTNKTKKSRDSAYLLKKDPKALMETISLIDSDSDDESASAKPQTSKANDDDVIIVDSDVPQHKTIPKPIPSVVSYKQTPKYVAKPPVKKQPTAQSNFLNAVNLQPAPKSNPATFSAQLSNKKVIIPNAFYGNPSYYNKPAPFAPSATAVTHCDESSSNDSIPRSVSVQQVQDRYLKEWLENFLTNFASPYQLASHACFVLLQRVLKYRFFQRLKDARVNLNTQAKNFAPGTMDVQMLLDLRNIFLENDKLTDAGRKFCRFATNEAFGKPVALTTDARSGKVTSRTRVGSKLDSTQEALKAPKPNIPDRGTSASASSVSTTSTPKTPPQNSGFSPAAATSTGKRYRRSRKLSDGTDVPDCDADDNDYTPYMGETILKEQVVSERKKSLRTIRTKRKEAGFTYSEDHDDEEFEALAKKIEDKKREELRAAEERELEKEREKDRKVKKTVAKKTTAKRQNTILTPEMETRREPIRKKLRLADTELLATAEDDLLTPTWIEADGDEFDDADDADSLLDFAEEPRSPRTCVSDNDNPRIVEEPTTNGPPSDVDDGDSYPPTFDVGTNKLLKNTDRELHAQSQKVDFCVHCLKRVPRTVHHYVNEHRSSEVFTARLRSRDIRRLLTTNNVGFVNLYKGNQQQYAAHCIFCDKEAKFLLPYWFEHFTMHTGEYSFKCSGCDIRKPTRSLLTNHLQSGSGCPKKGTTVRLFTFDTKSHQIEAHICTLCNYIQMHRKNVVRHLRTQHGIESISAEHIIKVVLLQVSGPYRDEEAVKNDEALLSLLQHSDDEMNGIINGSTSLDENSLMIQNDFTDNDDLSFMICGMLDVQTNLSTPGEMLANVDPVDNK